MTTTNLLTTDKTHTRREDFPVDSFRYLEGKLQEFRKTIMDGAAKIAASEDVNSVVYRIERKHIDLAVAEMLDDLASETRADGTWHG